MTFVSMDHGPAALMIVCANVTFLCLAGMTTVEPLVLVLGLVLFHLNFIMYLAISFTAQRIYALCDQAQRNQLECVEMYHEQQSDMITHIGRLCELYSESRFSSSSSSRSRSNSRSRSDYSQPWDSSIDRLYQNNSFYDGDGRRMQHSRPRSRPHSEEDDHDEGVEYYSSDEHEEWTPVEPVVQDSRPKRVPRRRQRKNHNKRQKKQAKKIEQVEAEYQEPDEADIDLDEIDHEGSEEEQTGEDAQKTAGHQCPCSTGGECTCGDDCQCA